MKYNYTNQLNEMVQLFKKSDMNQTENKHFIKTKYNTIYESAIYNDHSMTKHHQY